MAWLVVARKERLTIPSSCPPLFADLMRKCWVAEPKERLDFKQILEALQNMLDNGNRLLQSDPSNQHPLTCTSSTSLRAVCRYDYVIFFLCRKFGEGDEIISGSKGAVEVSDLRE